MTFNDILVETGGFGLYQKFLTFGCLLYSLVALSFMYWTQVFILLIPPHRCKLFLNDTEYISSFRETDTLQIDKCHITYENETIEECTYGMIYDFSLNYPTYVSEHDLVCENAWKAYLAQTIYWIGTICGTFAFGIVNDKYGRRRAFQGAVSITLISDIATYFCEQQIPFLFARFFSATGFGSIATVAFLLTIEHCIPSKRRLNIFVWSCTAALTSLSMAWVAYGTYNWRYILIISWIPSTGCVIMSLFLPESPSWLMTKGRIDEAIASIERMGKVNGRPISKEKILYHLQDDIRNIEKDHNNEKTNSNLEKSNIDNKNGSLSFYMACVRILKSPNLRKRILCLAFLWMVACSCYNGNNLQFQNLPFNMYITYSIGALVEIPGNFLVILTLDRFGRRWTNAAFFILGGIFGILSANVSSNVLVVVFVMLMRGAYSSAYDITFSFSSELLPTEIRGRTMSFIRVCGGMGSSLAPFVVSLSQKEPLLPLEIFGITGIIAGLSMLTLPETAHQPLPQSIEDAENFGTEQSFWFCPSSRHQPEKQTKDRKENHQFENFSNPAFEADDEQVKCVRIQKLPKY